MNLFHIIIGSIALIAGSVNFLRSKGTYLHRILGRTYAVSLTLLCISAFIMQDVSKDFTHFHLLAIITGTLLLIGMFYPMLRRKNPNWIEYHYFWMSYSFVGLLTMVSTHLLAFLPAQYFMNGSLILWGGPFLTGTLLIFWQQKKTIGRAKMRYFRKQNMIRTITNQSEMVDV